MSRYGYLGCHDCKQVVWLGKALFPDGSSTPIRFALGETYTDQHEKHNSLVWRFLAVHHSHHIAVVVEGDKDLDQVCEYVGVGGDEIKDVPAERFLSDWSMFNND